MVPSKPKPSLSLTILVIEVAPFKGAARLRRPSQTQRCAHGFNASLSMLRVLHPETDQRVSEIGHRVLIIMIFLKPKPPDPTAPPQNKQQPSQIMKTSLIIPQKAKDPTVEAQKLETQ